MSERPPSRYRWRPYADETDLRRMLDLCRAAYRDPAHGEYYHTGDILWQMFRADGFDAARRIRLWNDGDEKLVGFCFVESSSAVLQIHPTMRGNDRLEDAMLASLEAGSGDDSADPPGVMIETDAFDNDLQRLAILTRRGYRRAVDGPTLIQFEQQLSAPSAAEQPPGTTVRDITDPSEFAARVALHRAVWTNSRVTVASYRRMRGVSGYIPELDIVAVAPNGALASYCICWYDPVSRTGLFEPVGTHPEYRGRGYGRRVIAEGLRRLHARGAARAYMHTGASNAAAIRLYAATGFRIVSRDHPYRKDRGVAKIKG